MLPQHKKARRRRKSKQITKQLAVESNVSGAVKRSAKPSPILTVTAPLRVIKPKVKQIYAAEERDVQKSLLNRPISDDIKDAAIFEQEIAFFCDKIILPEVNEANKTNFEIDLSPASDKTNDKSDGQQLASSYIQVEDENVIKKIVREKVQFQNKTCLFLPKLAVAKRGDAEESDVVERDLADEGLFVLDKPKVSRKNVAQLVNRFIEDGSIHWLNGQLNDIPGLVKFIDDLQYRNVKTDCTKKFYPVYYVPHLNDYKIDQCSPSSFAQNKIFKIEIIDIFFTNHPNFDEEKIIAQKIELLHRQYVARQQENIIEHLTQKLSELRKLLLVNTEPSTSSAPVQSTEYRQQYKNDLKDTRTKWHREKTIDRKLIRSILQQWKQLKEIRTAQGFNGTSVKLIIRAEPSNEHADREHWDEQYALELNEILEESMEQYRSEKEKTPQHFSKDNEDFVQIKKINLPDVEEIRKQVNETFSRSMRTPGDPIVHIELHRIAMTQSIPKKSKSKKFKKFKYSVHLFIDDRFVSSVKNAKTTSDDRIVFNAHFSIKMIRKISKNIKILIVENSHLMSKKEIAVLYVPVPEEHEIFAENATISMNFTSKDQLLVSGELGIKVGWLHSDDIENQQLLKKHRFLDRTNAQIRQWYDTHLIDPMDPDTLSLIESIQKETASIERDILTHDEPIGLFRFNEDLTTFCSEDEINNDKRLNLLRGRFNSDLKFRNERLVPHLEREIQQLSIEENIFEELNWMDPIDVQRHNGRKYLKEIYQTITNHCEILNRNSDPKDLLIGDTPPTFRSMIAAIMELFGPKRPLNPKRRTAKSAARVAFRSTKFTSNMKLIVNIIRATGIPFRNQEAMSSSARRTSTISSAYSPRPASIQPFVQCSYKGKTVRTSTAEGSNPTWNESIIIPISSNEDHLHRDKDSLCIQIFDELIEELMVADRVNDIYQRISSKWLAEIRIPFFTIYAAQRISGTFQMATPPILVGYSKPPITSPDVSLFIDNLPEIRNVIYLTMFISLEPICEPVEFSTEQLECTELEAIQKKCKSWYDEFSEEFPERCQADALVSLSNGKRVCITRLIAPIPIPFERSEVVEYLIRRFVSLIPVYGAGDFCTKLSGIWLKNDQILSILTTSAKDLGVLLACYYASLGFYTFMVMGFSLPNGDTTFVLTKENGTFYLIDPDTGRKCSTKDTFCPLTKVYCLVNSENIWANIQKEHRVSMMQFDVKDSANWRACFNKSIAAPSTAIGSTIHDVNFQYKNSDSVDDLKKVIELKIIKKISSWRSNRRTIWNRNLNDILRNILVELEEDVCFELDGKAYAERFSNLSKIYKIHGFPINIRYDNLASIVQRVKSTGIHSSVDTKVEFALAIHIQPYPNNILSVWIFLISLIPLM